MVIGLGPGPEFDLIRRFLAGRKDGARPRPDVRIGAGDDCAVVVGDGIAVTVDMAVEDVHFRRAWLEPHEIGWRAAVAGLSDLAAMAARPIGVLASVALAEGDTGGAGEGVMRGIAEAAEAAGAALIGGDLVRSSGPLVVDIVALGEARDPVLRGGARPGDEVWVTGRLGGAPAAVAAWTRGAATAAAARGSAPSADAGRGVPSPDAPGHAPSADARRAFAHPVPRIAEALWLAERRLPTAMLDLSDGIAGDAGHIAAASGVRVVVEAEKLPVAPGAAGEANALALAAAGGEDYELCFTAAAGSVDAVREEFERTFGIPLTCVGRVEKGEGAVVVDRNGRDLELKAYQHWRTG